MTRRAGRRIAALLRSARLVALVAIAAAQPCGARAQVAEERSAASRAGDEFTAGERAYAEERYAEALEHFLEAQALDPHDVVRFNVAVCLQRLGRWSEAWDEYRSLIESAELDDVQREYARWLLSDLDARLARVRVTAPEAAEVRVDGGAVGVVPLELRLVPGPHLVSARDGERERTRRVTVERGETIDLALELPDEAAMRRARRDPGVLTYVGAGVAAVASGISVGLGMYASDLHDQYMRGFFGSPALDAQIEGVLFVERTNLAIIVAGLGLTMIAIDLILLAAGEGSREVEVTE